MPHIHDKIDFVSDVYIVNDGAVLLRMHEKYHEWFPPGGHVELDEDPFEAAHREVKEEVGLDVKILGDKPAKYPNGETEITIPRFLNRHWVNDTHEHIAFIYFAISDSRNVIQGETEISDDIRWFTLEDLENSEFKLMKRVKYYAKSALEAAKAVV